MYKINISGSVETASLLRKEIEKACYKASAENPFLGLLLVDLLKSAAEINRKLREIAALLK